MALCTNTDGSGQASVYRLICVCAFEFVYVFILLLFSQCGDSDEE